MEATVSKGRGGGLAAVLGVANVGSLLAALNLVADLHPSDKITPRRGCVLTLLGFVYFTTLFELLNTLALSTSLRQKYRLSCGDVLDVTNKLVSAVQAAFCCITGAIVCLWSCTRDFARTSHFVSEAYAWFGAAYFFYDIWSMYSCGVVATRLIVCLWSCTRDFARTSHFVSEAYAWFGAAYFFYDIWSMYSVHVQMTIGDAKGKRKTKNGSLTSAPVKQAPSFFEYCKHEPVILMHHLFIGGFGFLTIVYFRGGLGDCVFGFVYLMELSTPFVSLRGILSRLKMKSTRVYLLNGILMLLTFLFCRVLSLPYVCHMYSKAVGMSYLQVTYKMKSARVYLLNGILMLLTFLFCRVLSLPYVCHMYSKAVGMSYLQVTYKMKSARVYLLNGILMLLTFLFCRVLSLPYVCHMYSKAVGMSYLQAVQSLPTGCKISILILLLPQLYWFYLMSAGALKVFLAKPEEKYDRKVAQARAGDRSVAVRGNCYCWTLNLIYLYNFDLFLETSMSRIVSGWQAYPGQHPHQIYLRMVNAAGTLSACGGSVVHKNWFITAAHCTAQRVQLLVRAGLVHILQPQYDSETTEWYNFPSFVDELAHIVQPNDIAIAHVDEPFTFSHLLQPIKMQSAADAYRDYSDEQLIASGFGRVWTGGDTSENLNWVYLTGVSNALCFATFGTIITDTTICARFFNVTSQSTCSGDSGGPLVHVNDDGVPILIGVVAFVAGGDSGCHAGHPAGFTRVGPFHGWLTEITGIDFDNLEEDTEAPTEPPTEAPTEPPTEAPTEPPTEAPTEPPTEAPTEPPTEPPTEAPTEPPVTESPDSNESGEDESTEAPEPEEGSSEEKDSDESDDDDCEMSELLKKLEVKVNVRVKLNKYGRKNKVRHIKK
ncbi:uncharacterized protein LOC134800349 [Cydia splendana]|uniref:uncharacterized protein LOC134800349 n=1 Tax=Cydia splendana TaxID=1100963 RepID=UPI00300C08B3